MEFNSFIKLKDTFQQVEQNGSYKHFAAEEFLRFISLGGTILDNFTDVQNCFDQRMLSHIYLRSILENYFCLLYIFDGDQQSQWESRYEEHVNSFKKEYFKMFNEPLLQYKSELIKPDPSWHHINIKKDLKSKLAAVRTIHDDRLDYLYFTYRITSFDVHGKSLSSLAEKSFSKKTLFPVLKPEKIIYLISNEYVSIWNKIN